MKSRRISCSSARLERRSYEPNVAGSKPAWSTVPRAHLFLPGWAQAPAVRLRDRAGAAARRLRLPSCGASALYYALLKFRGLSESGGAAACIANAPWHATCAAHAATAATANASAAVSHANMSLLLRQRSEEGVQRYLFAPTTGAAAVLLLTVTLAASADASIASTAPPLTPPSPSVVGRTAAEVVPSVTAAAAFAPAAAAAAAAAAGRFREIGGGCRVDRARNLTWSSTDKPVEAPSIPAKIWRSRACSCSGITSASSTRAFGGAAMLPCEIDS